MGLDMYSLMPFNQSLYHSLDSPLVTLLLQSPMLENDIIDSDGTCGITRYAALLAPWLAGIFLTLPIL